MNSFKIIKGFRNIYDIDRLRIDSDELFQFGDWIPFLKKNELRGLTIYYNSDKKQKQLVDFSFLKEMPFLEYFECLIPLSQKSDVSEIYSLSNLKYLRWIVGSDFDIDFSKVASINVLNISDCENATNWESLINLEKLYIQTKKKDCKFISQLSKLTDLQLYKSGITSIEGLEFCNKLERLELIYCLKITELLSIIKKCPHLISLSLKKCKNVNKEEIERIKNWGLSLWYE
jgi:Leucine-rich repeat (LRR) protein